MTTLLALAPADVHALTMVAILIFALGALVTLFLVMARNGKKYEALNLPEFPEEKPTSKKATHPSRRKEGPSPDWEKDADWWK